MIYIFPTPITAYIGNTAFVVVGGRDAGIAMCTTVILAGAHQSWEVGICNLRGRWHAVVGIIEIISVGRGRVWLEICGRSLRVMRLGVGRLLGM